MCCLKKENALGEINAAAEITATDKENDKDTDNICRWTVMPSMSQDDRRHDITKSNDEEKSHHASLEPFGKRALLKSG